MWDILFGILERGLIGSFVVMGIYLASRVMKFDDFSLEGTYGLGGALVAWCLLSGFCNAWLSLGIAALGGALSGGVTGLLHTKLGLNRLIAGIVVATMLFSVSMTVGGANVGLGDAHTVFAETSTGELHHLPFLLILGLLIAAGLTWFMRTEVGFVLRSTGVNEQFVTSLGKSVPFYIILCLMLANGLSAFAGGLFVQYSGFFSVFVNVGILIAALAGCMLAELFRFNMFFAACLGSILYQVVIAMTIQLQVDPTWQKFITGLLIILILVLKKMETQKKVLA